jgi:hypothetical protein
MKLPEPNGGRIRAIIERARDLYNRGQMDRATWLQLNAEFVEASHGQLEMPGALIDSGKTEWFEALKTAPSERAA